MFSCSNILDYSFPWALHNSPLMCRFRHYNCCYCNNTLTVVGMESYQHTLMTFKANLSSTLLCYVFDFCATFSMTSSCSCPLILIAQCSSINKSLVYSFKTLFEAFCSRNDCFGLILNC